MGKIWTIDENDTLYDNWGYFVNNKEIAENTFSRSWEGIRRQAYKLGLGKRLFISNLSILNEARNYIDGLMLSDGCIQTQNNNSVTGWYQQGCKHKNWLDKINKDLYIYGLESKISNERLLTGGLFAKNGSIVYNLMTYCYIEFKEMKDRWYKRWYDVDNYHKHFWHLDEESGEYFVWKKIIPKNIKLTPECVANWYLGDGCISNAGVSIITDLNRYHILLATHCFLKEDTIFLADLLSEVLDIKCGITKRGVVGIYTQADISTFINYIKDYKVDCYAYKFPEELIRGN